mgnify:CR=1 FL=1
MSTSGIADFNMDFTEIAEEAFERAGQELRSGYDLRTARRSMNLLTIEWANRGINMWTIEQGSIPLVQGTNTYDLPADTIDVLEHVIRTNVGSTSSQTDLNISRISVSTYSTIPNKLTQARPIQVWVQRLRDNPKITVWPTPNQGTALDPFYTFVYWRLRRMQNAGTGVETPDVSFRFLPALVAGLAYYIAMKSPEARDRLAILKSDYEQQYDLAAGEDREKAPIRFVPRQMFIS